MTTSNDDRHPRRRGRKLLLCGLLLIGGGGTRIWWLSLPPRIPISPETTVVDGPLNDDGTIDYFAAFNEHTSQGVTADNNAAVLLIQALGTDFLPAESRAEYLNLLDTKPPPADAPQLATTYVFQIEELRDQVNEAGSRPWTRSEFPEIATWVDGNGEPLVLVTAATQRPRFYMPVVEAPSWPRLINAPLPLEQECREVARVLTARAMLRIGEGNFEEAWDDLLACHRLARLVAQVPMIISRLHAVAIDAIATGGDVRLLNADPPALLLEGMQHDIAALPLLPDLADAVDVGERFVMLDNAQHTLMTGGGHSHLSVDRLAVTCADVDHVLRTLNDSYDRLVEMVSIPTDSARYGALDDIEEEWMEGNGRSGKLVPVIWAVGGGESVATNRLTYRLLIESYPATDSIRIARERSMARNRMILVATALVRYRHAKSVFPNSLDELSPQWLDAMPKDPFNDQPFRYDRQADDAVRIYSVGDNGVDDGGIPYDEQGDEFVIELSSVN